MGFFGPYVYKSKKNKEKFWLHEKERGKTKLYFFSKNPLGALDSIPKGYEVLENARTGMPLLKKKTVKKTAEKK